MESIQNFLAQYLDTNLAKAIMLVLGSILVAKGVDILLTQFLLNLAKRTESTLDDELIESLHRPVFSTVVLIGLSLSIPLFELPEFWAHLVRGILLTLAVLIWTFALIRVSNLFLKRFSIAANRFKWLDDSTLPLFTNISRVVIFGLAIYFLLVSWNINPTAWLASAGIIGIALGLAAKDTLANLFGGLFIMVDAPYKLGDFIVLDTGERGRVTKIGLRSTRVLTRDDIEITIPNSITANVKIVNESGGPWEKERIRATIGVAYGSDLDRVRGVLEQAASDVEQIALEPKPRVRFREFGDSSLIFQVLCWIDEPVLRGQALDKLNVAIYNRLNDNGIEIPFPQRVLHFKPTELRDQTSDK